MLVNMKTLDVLSEHDFFKAHPNVSFPSTLTDDVLAPFDHAVLAFTPQPEFDSWTQELSEGEPEQRDGKWYQTWVLTPVTHTPEEEAERLERVKESKILQIDAETSEAILAGFDYTVNDTVYHFSYDAFDQQNFSDTANMCQLSLAGTPSLPSSVVWNSYLPDGTLVQQTFDAQTFLALYTAGAMQHKVTQMTIGGQRKAKVWAASTVEEVEAI